MFEQVVMISFLDVDGVWDCYFIRDDHGGFDHAAWTTRDEAIAWGRARSARVRVYDPQSGTAPYV